MTSKKKTREIAKAMFRASIKNGSIDIHKVKIVLNVIAKQTIQGKVSILRSYKRLVETALSKEQLTIETPGTKIGPKLENDLLSKTKAKRIIYKKNSDLVFGARITHGDWIYDETLDSKLEQIVNSV